MRCLAGLCLALLAACAPAPQPAKPALWQVTGANGEQAWLFGTIHALDRPAEWRSPVLDKALAASDTIVVEVAGLENGAAARAFADLSRSSGLPPLAERVAPSQRPALARLLEQAPLDIKELAQLETWAAALTLARVGSDALKPEYGIDRAVMRAAGSRPVVELEGADAQLRLFDALPEKEQRDLLALVLADTGALNDTAPLTRAWLTGDFAKIEAETRRGLLADPELRAVLFTGRNAAWAERVATMLASGKRPFVAVGTAHMAGNDGLSAMLTARGYKVERLQ